MPVKLLIVLLIVGWAIWSIRKHRPPLVRSVREARELLGVSATASEAEIRAAHRRLISRVHPDAGGSAALAGRVNAARDLLVFELNKKAP